MLALVYLANLMGDIQYKMWLSIRVREGIPHTQCFLYTFFLYFIFLNWTEIVSFVRKYKNLAYMVMICRDIGCFTLALVYLENLMGEFQYKMWFSIRVREDIPTLSVFLYTSNFYYLLDLN